MAPKVSFGGWRWGKGGAAKVPSIGGWQWGKGGSVKVPSIGGWQWNEGGKIGPPYVVGEKGPEKFRKNRALMKRKKKG